MVFRIRVLADKKDGDGNRVRVREKGKEFYELNFSNL
jgi:hypothetical protein